MCRRDDDALLSVSITPDEREILDEMRRRAGATSDANLFRIALWSLADHLDVPMTRDAFDLRLARGRYAKRAPNPQVSQHDLPDTGT